MLLFFSDRRLIFFVNGMNRSRHGNEERQPSRSAEERAERERKEELHRRYLEEEKRAMERARQEAREMYEKNRERFMAELKDRDEKLKHLDKL